MSIHSVNSYLMLMSLSAAATTSSASSFWTHSFANPVEPGRTHRTAETIEPVPKSLSVVDDKRGVPHV